MGSPSNSVDIPMSDVAIPDEIRRGVYANELFVARTRDEVVFDFIQTTLGSPNDPDSVGAEIVSRIIMSRGLATRIQQLLLAQDFEAEWVDEINELSEDKDRESA